MFHLPWSVALPRLILVIVIAVALFLALGFAATEVVEWLR